MNVSIFLSRPFKNLRPLSHRHCLRTLLCTAIAAVGVLCASTAALAATYTVNSSADDGSTGTLRWAIGQAADGDTIVFNNSVGTITLVSGAITISHSITITGPGAGFLTVSGNNASTVFAVDSGTVHISGLTIAKGNAGSSGYGGGIANRGTLTVTACVFSGNTSPANNGGAIYNTGTLTVDNSVFTGNSTGAGGAGIANYGPLTVVGSTFSGNTAIAGAGIINGSSTATIENSTFTGNSISGGGPGAGLFNSASMTVENTTVVNNLSGGGVWNNGSSTITLTNSIVSGNVGGDCPNCGTQASNNLIGGTASLGPLRFNGGSTQTMMPLPGSAAIGAGSSCLQNTDQRGFARPTTGACDLGAVETNYLTVSDLNDSGAGSLRDAIQTAISAGSGDIVFQAGLAGTIELASPLPMVTSPVNIAGPGANQVTISGATLPPGEPGGMLMISGAGASVNLSGLTFASSASGDIDVLNGSDLTLNGCAFLNNTGGSGPGSIVLDNDGSSVLATNTTFAGNQLGTTLWNNGTTSVVNSTFTGNSTLEGGAIFNEGLLKISDSTIDGNSAINAGYGGGIYNYTLSGATTLFVVNSIVSGNTSGSPAAPDDCADCGTQSPSNMIGGSPDLSPLQYNGLNATLQTMIPLPGSAAIQGGDATQVPWFAASDERGFPRLTNGKLDLGAVQTNYTSVNFVQQPTNTVIHATISPAVTVEVLETNTNLTAPNDTDPVSGIPITLTFSGTGTLAGTLTQNTNPVASFANLNVNATGTGNELKTSVAVTGTQTLTATSSSFDVALPTPTVSFNPPLPASVTYGAAPLTLKANTLNASGQETGQTVTFQVDSGPATVSGNVLTITGAGSVVVEVDAAAGDGYNAADATATIVVAKAALTATAASMSRAYGAANPVFTGSLSGAVNGDTFAETFSTTATVSSNVGGYPIVPAVTGANLADYTLVIVPGTLTISQAATTMTLGATATPVTPGTPVTLTATVTSATSGIPDGTVSFVSGSTQLGSAPLNGQGVATLTVDTLPIGTNAITADYSGSANFSASQAQVNVVVAPTFTLTSPMTGLSVPDGQSRELALTVASSNGYNGTVNFSCSGLPANTTCGFAPASVTFNGGANTVTVLLKITTNVKANVRSSAVAQMKPLGPLQSLPILPAIFFWLPGTKFSLESGEDGKPRKAESKVRKLLWVVVLMVVGASALAAVGCGASFHTPKGEQTITVTANGSGGITQSVSLQLTVQ